MFAEELSEEPLIFTKDSKAYQSHIKFQEHGEGDVDSASRPVIPPPAAQRRAPLAVRPKTLLSMKQTVVERITDAAERFEYYQRGLKQHLGKKNPFELYERWEILLILFVLVQSDPSFQDRPDNQAEVVLKEG